MKKKKMNTMPIYDKITQDDIVDSWLDAIMNCRDYDILARYLTNKVNLNQKSLKKMLILLGKVIRHYYNNSRTIMGHKNIIQPWDWLKLYTYTEEPRDAINNVTGEKYHRDRRRRYKVYVPIHIQRKWNGLD